MWVEVLSAWALVEVLFACFFQLELNARQSPAEHPELSSEERQQLLEKIVRWLTPENAPLFLSQWFFGAPLDAIWRGNLKEWLAWALFGKMDQHLDQEEVIEVETMIDQIEPRVNLHLQPGKNPAVKSCRLTLDPVRAYHRPLLLYLVIYGLSLVSDVCFALTGWNKLQVGSLTYWHRPPTKKESKSAYGAVAKSDEDISSPLVFLHGIGIGLISYQAFLWSLAQKRTGHLFAISLPWVAMKVHHRKVPSIPDVVSSLDCMLERHCGQQSACFMGHSYGTACATWMMNLRPERVRSCILCDPICFLLFLPDICRNFLYSSPKIEFSADSIRKLFIHYMAKRELSIAWALHRNFFWYKNTLFPDDLPRKTTVLLAGMDDISPTQHVRRHLLEAQEEIAAHKELEVIYCPNITHAGFLTCKTSRMRLHTAIASH